jgi:eukaryotic-like serine/threonine-protein kinase
MPIQSGTHLGPYEILSAIGAGGMGEVYRAHDPKLGRDVAIKVLPPLLSENPDRLRRFEQEARAAAALNHPNILAIYQMGSYEGAPYLVSELLEGSILRQQVARGPLPLRKVIDYGSQVARGLAAAHEKGIVHRDLKPENLFVTKDGRVKVLDFGLAKLTQPNWPVDSKAATVDRATDPGVVMGTVGYMSPEQVSGKPSDHRADIFALGCVLYEMVTGKRAFQKATSVDTLSAILHEDPLGISQLAPMTPPALQRVVHRCLEKDPEHRFQSASDLAFALGALSESSIAPDAATMRSGLHGRARLYRTAGGVALAGILLLLAIMTRPWSPGPRPTESYVVTNDGWPKQLPGVFYPIVTDGGRLYFSEIAAGNLTLAQVSTAGGETIPIVTPFEFPAIADISPDYAELLILGSSSSGLEAPLWIMPTLAGTPRRVGELEAHGATWAPGGEIVYANGFDLYRAKSDGGESHKLITAVGMPYWPRLSPDGRVLRFTILDPGTRSTSLWEVSRDGSNLHALLPGWNAAAAECCGNWSPDGRYFAFQSSRNGRADIWVLNEKRDFFLPASHTPVRLTQGPLNFLAPVYSPDAKTLFAVGEQRRGELVRYDVRARQFLPYLSGVSVDRLDFSRDGEWVTYVAYPDGTLWRSKIDGSRKQQLTSPPLDVDLPRWSPDETEIAFSGYQGGQTWKVYVIPAAGGNPIEMLPGRQWQRDPSWSADGESLVFSGSEGRVSATQMALFVVNVKTRESAVLPGSIGLHEPRWSPDGRYIAATTADSQKLLLFDTLAKKWMELTRIAIGYLNWSRDSTYLYADTFGTDPLIVRIRVPDGTLEKVASLKGLHRAWGVYGPWCGLAPDNSPLVTRDAGIQEIYSIQWPTE